MDHFLNKTTFGLNAIHPHHLETSAAVGIMIGTSLLTIIIIGISYWMYVTQKKTTKDEKDFTGWEKVSSRKLYFDELYHALFVRTIEWKSEKLLTFFENNVLVKFISTFANLFVIAGSQIRKISSLTLIRGASKPTTYLIRQV